MYLIYFLYACFVIALLSATTTGSSDMTRFSDWSTTTLAVLLLKNRKNGPIWAHLAQFTVKPSDVCIPIIIFMLFIIP